MVAALMLAVAVAESIGLPAIFSNTLAGEEELRWRCCSSMDEKDEELDLMLAAEFLSRATIIYHIVEALLQ